MFFFQSANQQAFIQHYVVGAGDIDTVNELIHTFKDLMFYPQAEWKFFGVSVVPASNRPLWALCWVRDPKEVLLNLSFLQGNQAVVQRVTHLQTFTIRRMNPAKRTQRIWRDPCRGWSPRRPLPPPLQGVITAAIKRGRIKTDTGEWCWCSRA